MNAYLARWRGIPSFFLLAFFIGFVPPSLTAESQSGAQTQSGISDGYFDAGPIVEWKAENGVRVLELDNGGIGLRDSHGWVRTNRLYSDFVLRFRFRTVDSGTEASISIRAWPGYPSRREPFRGYRLGLGDRRSGQHAFGKIESDDLEARSVTYEGRAASTASRNVGVWQDGLIEVERGVMKVSLNGEPTSVAEGLGEFTGYIVLDCRRGAVEFDDFLVQRIPAAREPFGAEAYRLGDPRVEPPTLLEKSEPRYPRESHDAAIEGEVLLEAVVRSDGSVEDVRVDSAVHPDLVEAAIACVRQWKFRPARRSGVPVPIVVTVEILFSRPGA